MSVIKEFYDNKVILLTGGTGMLGRLILAKFMRLGNVKEIVLLIREKRGKSKQERLELLLSGFLFQDMKNYDSNFKNKLKIVNADIQLKDFGMSNEDREYIKNNVEIVIHGAATVKFDEPIKKATAINVGGTKFLLELAKETKNLQSFVHVSTAYSQSFQENLKECFYSTVVDCEELMNMFEKIDDDTINALSPQIMYPWPNSYTFTKALAEDLVNRYKKDLPIAIIRPSIVQATVREPVPGYIDTIFGVMSLLVGIGSGIVRVLNLRQGAMDSSLDLIPADVCVNSTLAIAQETSTMAKGDCRIYNNVVCTKVKLTGNILIELFEKSKHKYPFKNSVWFPTMNTVDNQTYFKFLYFWYHYVPAIFFDIFAKIVGHKLRLVKIYNMIWMNMYVLKYFLAQNFYSEDHTMQNLYSKMSKEDHGMFPVRYNTANFPQHIEQSIDGVRKYLFKETKEDHKVAEKRFKYFKFAHYTFLTLFYSLVGYICLSIIL